MQAPRRTIHRSIFRQRHSPTQLVTPDLARKLLDRTVQLAYRSLPMALVGVAIEGVEPSSNQATQPRPVGVWCILVAATIAGCVAGEAQRAATSPGARAVTKDDGSIPTHATLVHGTASEWPDVLRAAGRPGFGWRVPGARLSGQGGETRARGSRGWPTWWRTWRSAGRPVLTGRCRLMSCRPAGSACRRGPISTSPPASGSRPTPSSFPPLSAMSRRRRWTCSANGRARTLSTPRRSSVSGARCWRRCAREVPEQRLGRQTLDVLLRPTPPRPRSRLPPRVSWKRRPPSNSFALYRSWYSPERMAVIALWRPRARAS